MHQTIQKVLDKLKKYPETEYELTENSITVLPKNEKGFPVTLTVHVGNSFTVAYDFWHEEFENEDEALNCLAFGLSEECRLKLTKRGQQPYKWTVEYYDEGAWREDSTTGLFNLKFWKKSKVIYLQNDLIKNNK